MTKLHIMSDLHLEFGMMDLPGPGEVLILAGDIGLASEFEKYVFWIEEVCNNFKHVIMVMGNHEHYHGDFTQSYNQIRELTSHIHGFVLLENQDIILDGVLYIGATMWSDLDPAYESMIQSGMNDYHVIKHGDRPLSTIDTRETHYKSIRYIEDRLKINKASEDPIEKVVVVTHHNPTMRGPEMYRNSILNSAYGTDYEDMVEAIGPNLWIFGHTHLSQDFTIGNTRLVCNPRGYVNYDVNPDFSKDMVVEI